jgi:hypothetical protein
MVPSFITWKSTSRSIVSKRKAVMVISFSGSSSNGCIRSASASDFKVMFVPTHLALQECSDLILHALRFTKEALVDAQPLEPTLAASYIVHLGCAIFDRSPK